MDRYQARELILKDSALSRNARLLYFALDNYQRENRECWPGQATLARDLGLSPRSVRYYLAELRRAGFCAFERRGYGQSNSYRLHWGSGLPDYEAESCRSVGQDSASYKANQALNPEIQRAREERQAPVNIGACQSCRGSGRVMIPAIGWSSCAPCRGTGKRRVA